MTSVFLILASLSLLFDAIDATTTPLPARQPEPVACADAEYMAVSRAVVRGSICCPIGVQAYC